MKKYINGKVYDTERAVQLADYEYSLKSQLDWYREELYRKRTGEFFIYGVGHFDSFYCKKSGSSSASGEKIIPLSYDEARAWAAEKLDAAVYDAIFGVPEESDKTQVQIRMQQSTLALLRDAATKEGTSMASVVEKLILGAYGSHEH